MSMMCPPQRVKITSIPSARSALATRWPPEIVSVSAPGAAGVSACTAVLVAVTSISSPSGARSGIVTPGAGGFSPSGRRPVHVVREIQRVLSDEAFGELGVAALEGLDDVHVVDDGALGPIVLPDHVAANRSHVHKQAGDEGADHGRAGELDDALVEAQVRLRVFVQVQTQLVVLERGEERAQAADLLVARSFAQQSGGHALERRPGSDHLGDLRLALAHDPDAPAGHDLHEPLVLEPGQRPAHGRAADAEGRGKALLVQPQVDVGSVDVHGQDGIAQRLVGQLPDADGLGSYRRDDQGTVPPPLKRLYMHVFKLPWDTRYKTQMAPARGHPARRRRNTRARPPSNACLARASARPCPGGCGATC